MNEVEKIAEAIAARVHPNQKCVCGHIRHYHYEDPSGRRRAKIGLSMCAECSRLNMGRPMDKFCYGFRRKL